MGKKRKSMTDHTSPVVVRKVADPISNRTRGAKQTTLKTTTKKKPAKKAGPTPKSVPSPVRPPPPAPREKTTDHNNTEPLIC